MASRTALSRLVAAAVQGSGAVAGRGAMPAWQLRRSMSSSSPRPRQEQTETSVASTSSAPPTPTGAPSPFEPSRTHPRTHNHHVASLHLRAHGPGQTLENLQFFAEFALKSGYALGIPLSRPASLPTRTSLWTVPRGPFVHKKSQENFERRVHKRVIKVWDADISVVETWLQFLRAHGMDGVGMRAEVYRHLPLSVGASLLAASTSQLRSVAPGQEQGDDATMRASEPDSEKVTRLAKAIIDEEVAKQDAEGTPDQQRIQEGQMGGQQQAGEEGPVSKQQ